MICSQRSVAHRSPAGRLRLLAAPALLALALSGCGGEDSSSAPDDASQADFCDAFVDPPDGLSSDDPDEVEDAAHDYADELRELGTPEGTSDDARDGFELYVDFLADLKSSDVEELEDADFDDVFEGEDLEKFEALSELTADCGPGEVPTE